MKRSISVRLDEGDLVFLKDKSRETGISISALVRQAVKEWIRREKKSE